MTEQDRELLNRYNQEEGPIYPDVRPGITGSNGEYLYLRTFVRMRSKDKTGDFNMNKCWCKVLFEPHIRISWSGPEEEYDTVDGGYYVKAFKKLVSKVEEIRNIIGCENYLEGLRESNPRRIYRTANQASEEVRLALLTYGPNRFFPKESFSNDGQHFVDYLRGKFNSYGQVDVTDQ